MVFLVIAAQKAMDEWIFIVLLNGSANVAS